MPLTADMLATDLRAMFADLPQTAEFSRPGKRRFSVAAAVDSAGGGETLADDASVRVADAYASVTVIASECAWEPEPGDRVRVGGRVWRVSSARRVPGDVALDLTVEALS